MVDNALHSSAARGYRDLPADLPETKLQDLAFYGQVDIDIAFVTAMRCLDPRKMEFPNACVDGHGAKNILHLLPVCHKLEVKKKKRILWSLTQ
jgi:hypothetical protein